MANTLNLYDLRREELSSLLAGWGFSQFHAGRLWAYLYRQKVRSFEEMSELRPDLLNLLQEKVVLNRSEAIAKLDSSDGMTQKYLLELVDGLTIETVIMRYSGRTTACLSTQVGCAMGCVFCATGQMGFARHLSPGEIVAQVLFLSAVLESRDEQLRNIVFMGMGEPLHNYEATMAAVDILTDDHGLAIGPRYITVSTVGLPPAIRRLADEKRRINLAVSLHAATDEERDRLVPVNKKWPLAEIVDACQEYIHKRGGHVFFEWALIAGKNDTPEQAHALGRLLQGIEAHVNLIPLNPTAEFDGKPSQDSAARQFQQILSTYAIPSTVRRRRGIDINAGCGQLQARGD